MHTDERYHNKIPPDTRTTPMTTTTVLGDGDVWPLLTKLASRKGRAAANIAVPYVSTADLDLRSGDTIVCDLAPQTLGGGLTSPAALLKYAKRGVEVFHCPSLHAKIYVFGSTAVLGSPNISASSQNTLREAISVTNDPKAVLQARELVAAFATIPYDAAALTAAQAMYRPPRPPPGGRKGAANPPVAPWAWFPPTETTRAWIVQVYDMLRWPDKVKRVAASNVRAVRRRAGPATAVRLASALINADGAARMSEGDVVYEVFWAIYRGAWVATVFSPARFVHAVPVPGTVDGERVAVAWWQRPLDEPQVEVEDFVKAARQAGVRMTTDDEREWREVRKPAARRALLDLWKP